MKERNSSRARPARKSRDAQATRAAILASARKAFAEHGSDGVGVREIAAGAGVTAMLVNRYFGSKERLFAEAVAATMATPMILTRQNMASPEFGAIIARTLVDITRVGDTPLEGFEILLRSISSRRAAEIGREQIEAGHQKTLADALSGSLNKERAALVLAVVAGFQMMRQMIGLSALANAKPDDLIDLLTPLFRQLVSDKDIRTAEPR